MNIHDFWKSYYMYIIPIILIILVTCIIQRTGLGNYWLYAIPLISIPISMMIGSYIKNAEKTSAFNKYDPIIKGGLKARYYRDGDQINGRWFIQLDISLRKSYAIIPKSMALLDKDSKELKWLLESYKVKRRGADDSKKFWNKEVEGGSFKLDLQCPEFKVKPYIHGEFSIKFVYDIAGREMERYYPINLPEYKA